MGIASFTSGFSSDWYWIFSSHNKNYKLKNPVAKVGNVFKFLSVAFFNLEK